MRRAAALSPLVISGLPNHFEASCARRTHTTNPHTKLNEQMSTMPTPKSRPTASVPMVLNCAPLRCIAVSVPRELTDWPVCAIANTMLYTPSATGPSKRASKGNASALASFAVRLAAVNQPPALISFWILLIQEDETSLRKCGSGRSVNFHEPPPPSGDAKRSY